MADYVNIKDVPLMRVGTWDASTGKEAVTMADLEAIVAASLSDDLDNAPVKIGHTDPRFDNPDFDGEPAYGTVANLRLTDDKGGTLVGDLMNVPSDLAEKMNSAYPYRSVEIAKDVEMIDGDGKVVAKFDRVLVGLALLGASAPAVKGLGEVHAELSASVRPGTTTIFSMGQFSLQGGLTTNQTRQAISAALTEQYRTGPNDYPDVWLEDFDDTLAWFYNDGQMWQSTYAVDAAGSVTFTGDPVKVKERRVFEPVTNDTAQIPRSFAESTQPNKERPAGANDNPKESADMAPLNEKQLARSRKLLGLADDATEADIMAALEADVSTDAHENPGTGTPPAGTTPGDGTGSQPIAPVAGTITPPPATAPTIQQTVAAAAGTPEPTQSVIVSAAQFSELTASNANLSAQLKTITDREDKTRRDGIVDAAFKSGRLHKDEVAAWRTALDDNETVTVSLLSNRQPVFPVTEIGFDVAPAAFGLNTSGVSDKELAADDALFGTNPGNGAN